MRVSKIRVKWICVNQGLGVLWNAKIGIIWNTIILHTSESFKYVTIPGELEQPT